MTDHPDSSTDAIRVEKSASKNDPPVVSSGSLTDFGVSPTNQTVSRSNSDGSVSPPDQSFSVSDCDVLSTDKTVSLTDFDALPTDQAVSPVHCSASPTGKRESLTNCGASPTGKAVSLTDYCGASTTDKTVSPTRCGVSPTDQTVSLTRCGLSPTDQTVSSTRCGLSPTDQTVSSTRCGLSSTDQTVSSTGCGASPTDQTVSPTRCGVSPTDQTVSPANCGVPHSVQVESHSGGNVSDSLVSASTTGGETASNSTAEINANDSFLTKELRKLNLEPNFTENALNVQTVKRRTLLPENKQYLTYRARQLTIPTNFPNGGTILEYGFYLKGAFLQCYSCGIRYSMSETSLQFWENHIDNCLHHQVKSKSLSQNEDVFVNRNAADTEACYKCKMNIKKVLFLECRHLMTCTDCLLEDLHRGPSETRTPGSAEASGQDGNMGLHEESIACPLCETLSSTYVIIQWD